MFFNARFPAALTVLLAAAACPAADPPALPDVLTRIAPQTHLAIVIPNLKQASDELTQCLEGMGKADLVGAARPIDLIKSQLNISVGVDDDGSAAIVLSDGPASSTIAMLLVPVNDANQFLTANFRDGGEPGRYLQADGKVVYAKPLGTHVAISHDGPVVRAYEPGAGLADLLKQRLGERGRTVWRKGDIVIYADQSQLKAWRDRAGAAVAQRLAGLGGAVKVDPDAGAPLLAGAEFAILAVDFDPLALIVNSLVSFAPASEAGRLTTGGAGQAGGLARLPGKPFYLAGTADIAGLGGAETLDALAKMLKCAEPPAWMRDAQAVQFAAYPSPAGMQGGILNDSVLVVTTPRPQDAKAAFRQFVTTLPEPVPGIRHKGLWQENRTLKSGTTADAYEVQTQIEGSPPEAMMLGMYESMLFGNAGWRGFVKSTNDALIVTFSQRPAVLDAALSAAAADSKSSLAGDAVIRTMRTWIPAGVDVEAYVGVGPVARLVFQVIGSMRQGEPMFNPAEIERVDPVGFALDMGDHSMQMTLVIPASVLGLGFDVWSGRQANAGPPDAPPPATTAPPANDTPAAKSP